MSLINDSDKVVQAIDFSGVQNKNMHPSDIDAVLEFDNKLLILMEIKIKQTIAYWSKTYVAKNM